MDRDFKEFIGKVMKNNVNPIKKNLQKDDKIIINTKQEGQVSNTNNS